MAITQRATDLRTTTSTSTASVAVAGTDGTPQTGDYRVVAIYVVNTTVATPSGWTLLGSATNFLYVFGKFYAADASATFTFGATVFNMKQVVAFTGVNTTTPVDVAGVGATNSNGAAGLTIVTPGACYFATYGHTAAVATATSATTPSGMTALTSASSTSATGQAYVRGAWELRAASGATGLRSFNTSGTVSNQAVFNVALRPAPDPISTAQFMPFFR